MKFLRENSAFLAITLAILAASPGLYATDSATGTIKSTTPVIERELIPGADRMTGAERDTYRRRMEAAATPEEKARIRAEYANSAAATDPIRPLTGDPVRGASLHRGCFGCHGVERYVSGVTYAAASFIDSVLRASGLSDLPASAPTRFKGKAGSLTELRAGVIRRNDLLNPKMTPQEIEDVVAYLNTTYYKFPQ